MSQLGKDRKRTSIYIDWTEYREIEKRIVCSLSIWLKVYAGKFMYIVCR